MDSATIPEECRVSSDQGYRLHLCKRKKPRRLEDSIERDLPSDDSNGEMSDQHTESTLIPTVTDYESFFEQLSETDTKPAILSLIPKYSNAYVPKRMVAKMSPPLQLLYKSEYIELDYLNLLKQLSKSQDLTN